LVTWQQHTTTFRVDNVTVTFILQYDVLMGFKFDRYYKDSTWGVSWLKKLTDIPPLYFALVNDADRTIHGISNPFRIAEDDITITLNERSYFPGEALNWDLSSTKDVRGIMIFKVPFEFQDPLQFYGANPMRYFVDWTGRQQIIDWIIPGLYQAVAFSYYGQVARGVSKTFKVKAETNKTQTSVHLSGCR
jgi:hypothetical protein